MVAQSGAKRQCFSSSQAGLSLAQAIYAYERMLKSDVKYRFSIDMASLKA